MTERDQHLDDLATRLHTQCNRLNGIQSDLYDLANVCGDLAQQVGKVSQETREIAREIDVANHSSRVSLID